jgi:hypothetical protein
MKGRRENKRAGISVKVKCKGKRRRKGEFGTV